MPWWNRMLAWIFPRVRHFHFTPRVRAAMAAMARETHPREAIGLLRGRRAGDTLIIDTVIFQPFQNTSYSAVIHTDPTLTNIVGSFHSHPGGNPTPSAQDRRMFGRDAGVHCILPEPYHEAYVYDQSARLLAIEQLSPARVKWRAAPQRKPVSR